MATLSRHRTDPGPRSGSRWRRRLGAWRLVAATAILAMTAAACSGGTGDSADDGSGSDAATSAAVAEAKALVEKWSAANSTWQGPTSAPAPKPGARVAIITCDQNAEGCARPARAQQEAAKLIGWETTLFDGQGNPAKQLEAINAAVDAKFDAIILDLVDTRTTQEGIKRALDQKIPMITLGNLKNEPESIPDVSHDWVFTGQLAGYYMIAKSEGKVNAFILEDKEFYVVEHGEMEGIMSVLTDKTKCPDCKIDVKQFQIANLESQPGSLAAAALQQDPSVNWVWCFDACMARVSSEVIARGIATESHGIGMNANGQNLQLIKDGQYQVMTVGNPYQWQAWASIDNLNRMLNGQPVVDQNIPVRIFDASNLSDLSAEEMQNGWNGGLDYRKYYRELWGVTG